MLMLTTHAGAYIRADDDWGVCIFGPDGRPLRWECGSPMCARQGDYRAMKLRGLLDDHGRPAPGVSARFGFAA